MRKLWGKKINFEKSTIFFSPNCNVDIKKDIMNFLQIKSLVDEKYLGLLPMLVRNKNKTFKKIKERIWKKVQHWKEKILSNTSKEILIKSVI